MKVFVLLAFIVKPFDFFDLQFFCNRYVDDQSERKHDSECSEVKLKQAFAIKAQEPFVNLLGKVRLPKLLQYCDILH